MIIAADRTGILPRLVCTPRHPLLDLHATNSTKFHVSHLFDLPRISKGTIRHAPQDNAINQRTPAIGWWNETTSESAPGARTGHQSQLRQQDPLATEVSGLHQRTQTCHHQANLLRHTTPNLQNADKESDTTPCRHSADLPASWKSKGSLGANVNWGERTGSWKELWLAASNVCTFAFLLGGDEQLTACHMGEGMPMYTREQRNIPNEAPQRSQT